MVSLTVYDGANGIGGNKIYLAEGDKGVFLDFGKNFGKYGLFYEEFLKSRDTRGIHDLIHLGLLPRLNIYRPDLSPSDLSLSQYPARNVAAVLLSHAHTLATGRFAKGYTYNRLAPEHGDHQGEAGHDQQFTRYGYDLHLFEKA